MPPELGYPDNDYNKKGPRPTTFSVMLVFGYANGSIAILNSHVGDIDKVISTGAKGIGFCAEEPRTHRQNSAI